MCAGNRANQTRGLLGARVFRSFRNASEDALDRPVQRRRTDLDPMEAPRVLPVDACPSLAAEAQETAEVVYIRAQPLGEPRSVDDGAAAKELGKDFTDQQQYRLQGCESDSVWMQHGACEAIPQAPQTAAGPITWLRSLHSVGKLTFVPLQDDSNHSRTSQASQDADYMDLDCIVQISTDRLSAGGCMEGHTPAEKLAGNHRRCNIVDQRKNFFGNRNGSGRYIV